MFLFCCRSTYVYKNALFAREHKSDVFQLTFNISATLTVEVQRHPTVGSGGLLDESTNLKRIERWIWKDVLKLQCIRTQHSRFHYLKNNRSYGLPHLCEIYVPLTTTIISVQPILAPFENIEIEMNVEIGIDKQEQQKWILEQEGETFFIIKYDYHYYCYVDLFLDTTWNLFERLSCSVYKFWNKIDERIEILLLSSAFQLVWNIMAWIKEKKAFQFFTTKTQYF